MTVTQNHLSLKFTLLVLLLMSIWTWGFLWLLTKLTPVSNITPALWYFALSLLLLLILISRLGFKFKVVLALSPTQPLWWWVGLAVGLGYFAWDHFLSVVVLNQNLAESIEQWQLVNRSFAPLSVFLSSVLLAPWFEELFFRGLLFKNIARSFNPLLAAIVSAGLFALIHWQWPDMISLFLVGLIYAWMTFKSGSVYPAITAHMIHNGLTLALYTDLLSF